MDREESEDFLGGAPAEGTHREMVGAGLVSSELLTKVGSGVEAVGVAEMLAVFFVVALDFAVVSGRVGPDRLLAYARAAAVASKSFWDSHIDVEKWFVNSKQLSVCTHSALMPPALEPFDRVVRKSA